MKNKGEYKLYNQATYIRKEFKLKSIGWIGAGCETSCMWTLPSCGRHMIRARSLLAPESWREYPARNSLVSLLHMGVHLVSRHARATLKEKHTIKAPVFGTLNSAISNFQTWFVRTVMEVLKHKDSFGKSEHLSKIFFAEILVFDHDYEGKSSSSNGLLWISFIFFYNSYTLSTILCKV